MTTKIETAIAKDLELCDLIDAIGDKRTKRRATESEIYTGRVNG